MLPLLERGKAPQFAVLGDYYITEDSKPTYPEAQGFGIIISIIQISKEGNYKNNESQCPRALG